LVKPVVLIGDHRVGVGVFMGFHRVDATDAVGVAGPSTGEYAKELGAEMFFVFVRVFPALFIGTVEDPEFAAFCEQQVRFEHG
jgi:hypothetical protein